MLKTQQPRRLTTKHVPPSPIVFQRNPTHGLVLVSTVDEIFPTQNPPGGLSHQEFTVLKVHRTRFGSPGSPRTRSLLKRLGAFRGIVTSPGHFRTPSEEAEFIRLAAESGLPIVGTISDEVSGHVGREIADLVSAASLDDLVDLPHRERLSVALRRSQRSPNANAKSVAVVLCTNRPEFVAHALGEVGRQLHPNLSLVLVAHGEGFGTDEEILSSSTVPTQVIRASSDIPFGEALNMGVQASDAEFVTKMDDDDWYSPLHISDLLQAFQISGAPLVAKGAEFVYLDELDVTIRRMVDGADSFNNRNVAGGTFLIRRSTLLGIGGWQPVERHVDQALLDDMARFGLPWYRTHGFGYILNRRAEGHTWDASIDYFLDLSVAQYRGLAVEQSLVDD